MKLLYTTAPAKSADKIVKALLEDRLIACANMIKGVSSRYWWKDKIEKAQETFIIMKTTDELADQAIAKLTEVHPYDVPEAIVVDIEKGSHPYFHWIGEVTRAP